MQATGLTGRFNLRRAWTGKIVLQVEEDVRRLWPFSLRMPTRRRWRDATLMDLTQTELRPLMDLRFKPIFGRTGLYGSLASQAGMASYATEQPPRAANANWQREALRTA